MRTVSTHQRSVLMPIHPPGPPCLDVPVAQVYKRVEDGVLPAAIEMITDADARRHVHIAPEL